MLSTHGLQGGGPHHFTAGFNRSATNPQAANIMNGARLLPAYICVILHYESASVTRWRHKFSDGYATEIQRVEKLHRQLDEQSASGEYTDGEIGLLRENLMKHRGIGQMGDPAYAGATGGTGDSSLASGDVMRSIRQEMKKEVRFLFCYY